MKDNEVKRFFRIVVGPVGVILALGGAVAFGLGYITVETFEVVLGIGGFAGVAGLRAAIASSGKKTFIIAIGGALVSVGVGTGVVKPESAAVLLSILGMLASGALQHAAHKLLVKGY